MITHLSGEYLPEWITSARGAGLPGISSFAKGLEQDLDAVTNGLTMPWSSGPVEGRVNHIKMIKRQMFGHASLPLLRKRVLLPHLAGVSRTGYVVPGATAGAEGKR
jgi:transposase